MEIKVIKGTKQIGGCITKITTSTAKIVVDFGEDLDDEKKAHLDKEALVKEISDADAVFITHSHADHVGLINMIPSRIDVFMEEATKKIVDTSADFGVNEPITRPVKTFKLSPSSHPTIDIHGTLITPYIVDHSSYNSCMFLIEAEGKRVLHTGDYRNHGRKGKLFEPTLRDIGQIDCLITEGTTLSRKENTKYMTEEELEIKAKKYFAQYDQVIVLTSSTNLDRITSFYKANGDKKIVFDTFTSAITKAIDFKITTYNKDVYQWNPIKYRTTKTEEFKNRYMNNEIDYGFLPNYILFAKQSMFPDILKQKKEGLLTNACYVYSMWHGYIDKDEKMKRFLERLERIGIEPLELHTSGHADEKAMRLMNAILKPKHTIIIHTEKSDKGYDIFDNSIQIEDGQTLEI